MKIYLFIPIVCSVCFNLFAAEVTNEIDGIVWICRPGGNGADICRVELSEQSDLKKLRDVSVPRRVGSCKIIRIGKEAFSGAQWLRTIRIHDSIVQIEEESFANCSNLVSVAVEIPKHSLGLRSICTAAFSNCTSLEAVNLRDIPVSMISRDVFSNCKSLVEIQLPRGLMILGVFAFDNCERIEKIELPKSLGQMPSGLEDLFEVPGNAFRGCARLRAIVTEPDGNYCSEDGILYDKAKKRLIRCPTGYPLETVKVRKGVTDIMPDAFEGCKNVKHVVLPDSLQIIGDVAFCSSGVEGVVLPSCLARIGYGAFAFTRIKELAIPKNVKGIGEECFLGCDQLGVIRFEGERPEFVGDRFAPTNCIIRVNRRFRSWEGIKTFHGCPIEEIKADLDVDAEGKIGGGLEASSVWPSRAHGTWSSQGRECIGKEGRDGRSAKGFVPSPRSSKLVAGS